MDRRTLILFAALSVLLPTVRGQCQIAGVGAWDFPHPLQILDTDRDEIFRGATTNINNIQSSQHSGDALNRGPYFAAQLQDGDFVLSMNDAFEEYEEYEYSLTMSVQVVFTCAGGASSSLIINIQVQDTNNNSPRFVPSDSFTFSIIPPIVPGYELTACFGDIVARDIDLTTQSIVFSIEDNPYFEMGYGGRDPADAKNFFAVLRAVSVIRSLAEPLVLAITAQDVDLTGDPPRTTAATIRIEASAEYELPAEPVFSEPFYTGTYSADHTLTLHQTIELAQGYDDQVIFTLSGDYAEHFTLTPQGNSATIQVAESLEAAVLAGNKHLVLVVHAGREHTSGGTAALIVDLPLMPGPQFTQHSFEGVITDNVLALSPLTLSETGSDELTATVNGLHSEHFSAQVTGATVTVSMSPLPEAVIQQNNFISVEVQVSSSSAVGASSASAVLLLDIVKDDTTTPVFTQEIYSNSDSTLGDLQPLVISLAQGFDGTVQFSINGDGSEYFDIEPSGGNSVELVLASALPPEVVTGQKPLLFTVLATKPRTVGASAAVFIYMPLSGPQFTQSSFEGVITDNVLGLSPLTLSEAGSGEMIATVNGLHSEHFSAQVTGATVTVSMSSLPEAVIQQNNFISVEVQVSSSSAVGASSASAVLLLDIVKDDTTTPVFTQEIYSNSDSTLGDLQPLVISLAQGFDGTVQFSIDGDGSEYFDIEPSGGNSVELVLASALPPEVVTGQQPLLFTVLATKPRTVGATAAVFISMSPRRFRFDEPSYTGTLDGSELQITPITLVEGYEEDVTFTLYGDYRANFQASNAGSSVTIELLAPLPEDTTEANTYVILILEASGTGASAATTVITVEIIKREIATPVFSQYVYTGLYHESESIIENINLSQGYDDTVEFELLGEYARYLRTEINGNSVNILVETPLPAETLAINTRLLFSLVAHKPGTVGANAALNVELPTEVSDINVLRFERVINEGSVLEELHLDSITLIDGFRDGVTFSLTGDHSQYFTITNIGNVVTIELPDALPQEVMDVNTVILLVLEASGAQSISAQTAIVLEILNDDAAASIVPVFGEPFYSGSYNDDQGLEFNTLISLIQGYDDTVIFSLSGEYSQYFSIQQTGNSVALSVPIPIPSAVIANNRHLIFSINAAKSGTGGARSAISISFTDEVNDFNVLRFERVINEGSVLEELHLDSITLIDGFRDGVTFSLTGDHSQYFTITNIGNVVTIELPDALPQEVMDVNTVILLVLEASGAQSISAQTAIVLEILNDDAVASIVPVFGEPFYSGSYNDDQGLEFNTLISLIQGYDDTVIFSLSGEYSQYFSIQQTGNSVVLSVPIPIPSAVIANNRHLIFSINAAKSGTGGARSAISISFTDEVNDFNVLRFERVINEGSVLEELHLDSITLIDGFRDGVTFSLTGDHSQYFTITNIGNVVTIELPDALPQEVMDVNTVILLVLEASGAQSISAQTAIVLEILNDDAVASIVPVFGEPFYSGSYNDDQGLEFNTLISLIQGYDDTVIFSLSGEYSQYFSIQQTGNSVVLSVPIPIPSAVIANNRHLIFSINAAKSGTGGARSAISISFTDEVNDFNVLRFERVINEGSVLEELHLDSITLIDGFRDGVTFSLTGDHSQYFTITNIGNVVTIELPDALPQEVMDVNTVILLVLEASGAQSISAQTAIVLEILNDDAVASIVPVFGEPFYSGSYNDDQGLEFNTLISLIQGYDDTVIFSLSGEYSQYFSIQQTGNSVALSVPIPIPSAVIANNRHLIFSINAAKSGTGGARSAISISFTDEVNDFNVLRFERVINEGSVLEELHLDSITLIDGFRDGVTFSLTGDHSQYFTITNIGNVVTIELPDALPQEVMDVNTVILLVLEASGAQSISAQTAIVLEILNDDAVASIVPVFGEPFYSGSYNDDQGLEFNTLISLIQGYDDTVIFSLSGEYSQYFSIQQTGNSVVLSVPIPIPSAVIANNRHLIFSINAAKSGTGGARSAISISFTDEVNDLNVLRFERVINEGSVLEELHLDSITLIDGFRDGITFSLTGDHSQYFTITNIGNVVTIELPDALPQEVMDVNTVILLVLEASGAQSISAQTAIVLEILNDDAVASIVPVFGEPFYSGSYNDDQGLEFNTLISLIQGYDDTVIFSLSGEYSQYFSIQQTGNSVALSVPIPIPSAVIANNRHLIFSINAAKSGTGGARSAISISFTDEVNDFNVLRFERVINEGSVLEELHLDSITLIDGFRDGVTFSLTGDHSQYFTITNIGNVVTIELPDALPQEVMDVNTVILLVLEASGAQSISAQTAIVLEILNDDAVASIVPVFGEPFYSGSYNDDQGLEFNTLISLIQGYDDTVIFSLSGEYSQYFSIQQTGNSVALSVPIPIPSAVIANNRHLIFSINAAKSGTGGARSAISISFTDEVNDFNVLRFERVINEGSVLEELHLDSIMLIDGFRDGVTFSLTGDHSQYFTITNIGNVVTIELPDALPQEVMDVNTVILLVLEASGAQSISAQTAIVLEILNDDAVASIVPVFGEPFYSGSYNDDQGLEFNTLISLIQGYDDTVIFSLSGEYSQYFSIQQTGNSVALSVPIPIPSAVIANNRHLIFSINAAKSGTGGARSAISISFTDEVNDFNVLRFERVINEGSVLEELHLDSITLIDGFRDGVTFSLTGDHSQYFTITNIGNVVTIELPDALPQEVMDVNTVILLVLEASGAQSISAQTAIVLEILNDDAVASIVPVFGEPFYSGSYNDDQGLEFNTLISLIQGYDDTVIFSLSGEYSQYFSIQQTGNSVALSVPIPIPSAVIANNRHLIFSINAAKSGTGGARSAISISFTDEVNDFNVLRFERVINEGSVLEELHLDSITLIDGFRDGVTFSLTGDHSQYFTITNIGNVVTIELPDALPQEVMDVNTVILLVLEASGAQSISAQTAIVLEILNDDAVASIVPVFGEPFYSGSYNDDQGLEFNTLISLIQGYDDTVIFSLSGEYSQYFSIQQTGNSVALSVPIPIPSAVIANNRHLIFSINAAKSGTGGARSAISISFTDEVNNFNVLRFERVINDGSVLEELHLDSITLIDGFRDGVTFSLTGDHSQYFTITNIGNVVTIELPDALPQEVMDVNTVILLVLEASGAQSISAQTAIVLEILNDDAVASIVPVFGEPFYSGSYNDDQGLEFNTLISLIQGYDDTVIFSLSGEYSQYFSIQQTGNSVALSVPIPIPSAVIANNRHLIFSINAAKSGTGGARSAISISFTDGSETGVFFDRALYTGSLELRVISHEPIFLSGYTGSDVQISGAHSSEFRGEVSAEGRVEIHATEDASVPPDVSHVALELQADTARTALVLTLLHPTSPEPPRVEFERSSYALRSDVAQSGLVGRVLAVAENGETLHYSLLLTNSHLQERLSVSNDGELWLSAPAYSGVYQFTVRATTVATQVTAEATVHLTVDSVMVCGADDDRVVQPLIVLDRDEEEAHDDLVLNDEHAASCTYDFNYRWPLDKDWLYINDRGHLSTRAIDREDPAIAFMALSQVQIELILTCTDDDETRSRQRREVYSQNRTNRDLGPYDYGNNRWILTEGIGYDARRSFVNIIINDINDNPPIFVDKENEPVVVGYPVPDLLEAVTPSALVTLLATDADIGENAALVYWSAAPELAVSARSGAVHVRDNAARALQSGSVFTVSASDLAGAPGGHTGNIDIMVRLLELNNIVVLTVRNALLEDEGEIIQQLSDALQYDIKTLRATVISDEYDVEEQLSPDIFSKRPSDRFYDSFADKEATIDQNIVKRSKRQAAINEAGASLRIFIYGLVNTQPIEAEQIISDIDRSELTAVWSSYEMRNLEEHLDEVGNVITVPGSGGSNTGLLVSTIVLSCLLLILIVFCIGWYLVKWRKANNYKEFSDTNSQMSVSQNLDPPPKLEDMVRPRPKIEDIKRSERRLQEMLDQPLVAPIQETTQPAAEPETSKSVTFNTLAEVPQVPQPRNNVTFETISEVAQPDKQLPIVIQSIDKLKTDESTDDEDEFGERFNTRRKSVVTFNEQVEKIIHVDNIADDQEDEDDVQVHKL